MPQFLLEKESTQFISLQGKSYNLSGEFNWLEEKY